jgi:DNA-binding MarR family transcriptional regulator
MIGASRMRIIATAQKRKPKRGHTHPFAYEGLDRVMHERARLSVLTSLLGHPKGLTFVALKQLCGLTDGNLSRHLEVLESAGLVGVTKTLEYNRPQTVCRITSAGRKRFVAYLSVLEQVLLDAESAGKNLAPAGALHTADGG